MSLFRAPLDAETGLHHNRYRTYDPQLGRYLQADPIGLAGGKNPYNYVNQNPLNGIDPDGLLQWGKKHKAPLVARSIHGTEDKYVDDFGWVVPVNSWKPGDGDWKTNPSKWVQFYTVREKWKNPYGTDYSMDCHGLTFGKMAKGVNMWIDNDQVDKILVGDGYALLENESMAQKYDVVIYRDRKNNEVVHSATYDSVGPSGPIVYQKAGIVPFIGYKLMGPGPDTAWERKDAYTQIWRKK